MNQKQKYGGSLSKATHYATLAALLISNLTVLTLGGLFSTQVGLSMASIAAYGDEVKVQKSQAAVRKPPGGGPSGKTKPAAPTELRGTLLADPAAVALTWNDNSLNESGFVIERGLTLIDYDKPTSSVSFQVIGTVPSNPSAYGFYRDIGPFQEYRKYWYQVKAYNNGGSSAYTNVATFIFTDLTPPSIPEGLRVTQTTCSGYSWAWDASQDNTGGSGVWGYKVYESGEFARNVYDETSESSSLGFYAFSTHTYQLAAFDNQYNVSALSSPLTINRPVSCPPVAPRNPVITNLTAGSLTLSWDDYSNNESTFSIERNNATSTYGEIGNTDENITTFVDGTVFPSQQYCYVIRAQNQYGYSNYSQEACATTPSL